MSKLVDAVKNSSPNVKLGIAIAGGIAVGVIGTVAVQAYGAKKEKEGAAQHSLPIRVVRLPADL